MMEIKCEREEDSPTKFIDNRANTDYGKKAFENTDSNTTSSNNHSLINLIEQFSKEETGSDFDKDKHSAEISTDMQKNKVYSSSNSSVDLSSSNDEEDDSDAESTDLNEFESTKRRSQCMDKISVVEKYFGEVKDRYYKEKYNQATKKLKDVQNEIAIEYRNPCKILEQRMDTKLQICDVQKKLRKESIKLLYEAEIRANNQHFENEKQIMIDSIKQELEDKIKALQEDRDNVDYSEIWSNRKSPLCSNGNSHNASKVNHNKKNKRSPSPYNFGFNQNTKKKKKPVTVTGPYVVYMLKENEILDDWAVVKRALAQRKKPTYKSVRMVKPYNSCKYIDNKLLYNGKWFHKGQGIVIDHKDSTTTMAKISSIRENEIGLNHSNGLDTKLYFNELERGKISIRHKKKWHTASKS